MSEKMMGKKTMVDSFEVWSARQSRNDYALRERLRALGLFAAKIGNKRTSSETVERALDDAAEDVIDILKIEGLNNCIADLVREKEAQMAINDKYAEGLRLISSIYSHGGFVPETPNEFKLEALLRLNGYPTTIEQWEAAEEDCFVRAALDTGSD